jgi:hypothetical protein
VAEPVGQPVLLELQAPQGLLEQREQPVRLVPQEPPAPQELQVPQVPAEPANWEPV